jgi:hypothetical protein
MIGTAAISSPVSELDRRRSASDSSAQGSMISTTANSASHRQCAASTRIWPRRMARGSSTAVPTATRANTSTGTATPVSATLMSK